MDNKPNRILYTPTQEQSPTQKYLFDPISTKQIMEV